MHESTRRGLCRIAFALFAALPLFITAGFCVAEAVPAYQRARIAHWERTIADQFGVDAHIQSVDVRSPERMIIYGVILLHPETKQFIADFPVVEVLRTSSGVALRTAKVQVEADRLKDALSLLHDRFLSRPADRNQVALIEVKGVEIKRGQATEDSLSLVRVDFKWTPEKAFASCQMNFTNSPGEAPAKLSLSRSHTAGTQATSLKFENGTEPIPCRMLSRLRPELAVLGPRATFEGNIDLHLPDGSGWLSRASGWLREVDSSKLTEPPQMAGTAVLTIEDMILTDAGLDRLQGQMRIGPGRISHNLLNSLGYYLAIPVAEQLRDSQVSSHPFEEIAFEFDVNPMGLRLNGLLNKPLPRPIPGALMADSVHVLAAKTGENRVSLGDVVVAISRGTVAKNYETGAIVDIIKSPMMKPLMRVLPVGSEDETLRAIRSAGFVSDPKY